MIAIKCLEYGVGLGSELIPMILIFKSVICSVEALTSHHEPFLP